MTKKPSPKPSPQPSPPNNSMWGGRFSDNPSEVMQAINASIDYDKRLFRQDIEASLAHASMLVAGKIISKKDGDAIAKGLKKIAKEIESGGFNFKSELEDIHMNIESRLRELIGDAAARLHTGRSRNDQVVTDVRLWLREASGEIESHIGDLLKVLLEKADKHAGSLMPGYTHLQVAQPVTFGHHLMAYVEMFIRDLGRLQDSRKRANELPLGAAALAGTGFPIDRNYVASLLGFDSVMKNSMDAVSSRDFILEFLSFAVIHSVHLSRLAEEMILWSNSNFNFIRLSDSWTTGSSIMPQKRNPDAAELVRSQAGMILGHFVSLSSIMKALPLAYAKDMQGDKQSLFAVVDALDLGLRAMVGMVGSMEVHAEAMESALRGRAGGGFATATDLADALVRDFGMPFRDAHRVCGELVRLAESKGCDLHELSLADMQSVYGDIDEGIYKVLGLKESVESRKSFGGTAPKLVKKAVAERKRWLSQKMGKS